MYGRVVERSSPEPISGVSPSAAPTPRIDAVDVARGVALAAMAAYHFAWDLSFFRLIVTDVGSDPAWKWFARAIAGSFLFLAGVSLVLAHGEGIRRRAFAKRLAQIAAAAAAITLVTYVAFPQSYIFFGILHCIALSSLLALPFLRAPWPLVLIGAGIVLAAPHMVDHAIFERPILAFLGLGDRVPVTNDYVPIFPWFGAVLAGVGVARAALPVLRGPLALWSAAGRPSRGLRWAGRHSLVVYLVHQPILLALLYPIALAAGPNPAAEARPFLRECERTCGASGRDGAACRRACACAVEAFKTQGLWPRVQRDDLTAEQRDKASSLARQCFGQPLSQFHLREGSSRPLPERHHRSA
jgi:uncharacterized membrane protein